MCKLKVELIADTYVYTYTSGEDDRGRPYQVRVGVSKYDYHITYIIPVYMMKDDTELITEALVAVVKDVEIMVNNSDDDKRRFIK